MVQVESTEEAPLHGGRATCSCPARDRVRRSGPGLPCRGDVNECAAGGTPAYSALASLSTSATVLLPNGFLAFQAFCTALV